MVTRMSKCTRRSVNCPARQRLGSAPQCRAAGTAGGRGPRTPLPSPTASPLASAPPVPGAGRPRPRDTELHAAQQFRSRRLPGGARLRPHSGCDWYEPQVYSQPKTVKKRESGPNRRTRKLWAACDVTEGWLGAQTWMRRPQGRLMATGPSHPQYPVRWARRVAFAAVTGLPSSCPGSPGGDFMLTQGARAQGGSWGGQGACKVSSSSELPTRHVSRANSHVPGASLALSKHLPSLRAERLGEHTSVSPPCFWPVACHRVVKCWAPLARSVTQECACPCPDSPAVKWAVCAGDPGSPAGPPCSLRPRPAPDPSPQRAGSSPTEHQQVPLSPVLGDRTSDAEGDTGASTRPAHLPRVRAKGTCSPGDQKWLPF